MALTQTRLRTWHLPPCPFRLHHLHPHPSPRPPPPPMPRPLPAHLRPPCSPPPPPHHPPPQQTKTVSLGQVGGRRLRWVMHVMPFQMSRTNLRVALKLRLKFFLLLLQKWRAHVCVGSCIIITAVSVSLLACALVAVSVFLLLRYFCNLVNYLSYQN